MNESETTNWGLSETMRRPLNILVVDDDPMNQALLGDVCEAFGWETEAVNRGDQVLSALHTHRPDLLLLDLMLPGMDGFAVLEQVRADPKLDALPVVVVSAISDQNAVWRAGSLGVQHYLVKPISLDEFRKAVDDVLSHRDRVPAPGFRDALIESMLRLTAGPESRRPSALVVLGVSPASKTMADALSMALLDDFPRPQWIHRMGEGRVALLIPGADLHETRALYFRLSKYLVKKLSDKVSLGGAVVILDREDATVSLLSDDLDQAMAVLSRILSQGGGIEEVTH